jgi:hypothetical protein
MKDFLIIWNYMKILSLIKNFLKRNTLMASIKCIKKMEIYMKER